MSKSATPTGTTQFPLHRLVTSQSQETSRPERTHSPRTQCLTQLLHARLAKASNHGVLRPIDGNQGLGEDRPTVSKRSNSV
jgi:hypothetical protein